MRRITTVRTVSPVRTTTVIRRPSTPSFSVRPVVTIPIGSTYSSSHSTVLVNGDSNHPDQVVVKS